MGKIYNCVRMKCKTLYQQIHALFSMGSELEDAVTSDINNFEQRLDDYADVNMQNSQDIQDLRLGIMRPEEYRAKWYGETTEQALKNLPQSAEVLE